MMTATPNALGVSHQPAGDGRSGMGNPTTGDAVRQPVGVVRQCYEAVGRGDVPGVLDLLTDDVEWTLQGPSVIPFAGSRRGRGGVAEFFSLVGDTLEFHEFQPREFVAQGNTVVVLGHERSLVKPTGRTFEQEWAHIYTLRDGKIARFRAFEDTATLAGAFSAG
ncbi:MAG: nuclear transport factor 2 family protein [Chloroflexota bacterium]|nr:nuclear transport factor 2 family protein [Chloroflexota bacterium]